MFEFYSLDDGVSSVLGQSNGSARQNDAPSGTATGRNPVEKASALDG